MLIGIDGNEANVKNRVGSNIYAYELLQEIYSSHDSSLKFKIYLKEEPLGDLPKETEWWRYRVVGPKKFWTQFALPWDLFWHRSRPDVFFTPGHYSPRFCPCPRVMAILDLAYIHFPEMFNKRDLWQLRRWTAHSVKKAKKIFTISQASKNDIIKYYSIESGRVVVIYPGFKIDSKHLGGGEATTSTPARWMKKTMRRYRIKGDFILYVGTLQPRKNLVRLIEAHNILISQYPNLSLVIVGKKGWLYGEIFQKVKQLGLEDRVVFTGFVPDEELPEFYRQAQCFVLVSLYEGFGLPVLEAMSYGCPVVASNVSSLPEVVGEAGILVDPEDTEEIARGIKKAMENREELIKKGKEQVKKFSWEKCAKETLALLEEVGKKKD